MSKDREKINSILNSFNSGKSKEAYAEITNIIKKNNTNLNYIYVYGLLSNKIGYEEKAIKSFKFILSKEPKNINALKNLYPILINNMILDESKNLINQLIIESPNNYTLLRDRAYVTYLEGDFESALTQINKALNINNDEVFGINIKGLTLFKLNNFEESITNFKNAIKINSDYIDSYNNLGMCYYKNENLNEAYKNFKLAYKKNPKSILALINIANTLSLKDKNKVALNIYNNILKSDPTKNEMYINLCIAYCKMGKFESAKINYIKAKKIFPNNYDLQLSYAYLLLTKNRYNEAWDLFDSRLEIPTIKEKNKNYQIVKDKLFLEKKLSANDSILILREQGIGEEILFSSMYKDLLTKYKKISIEADPRLINIFKRSFNKNCFYEDGYFSNNKNKILNFNKIIYAGSLTKIFRKKEHNFPQTAYLLTSTKTDKKIKDQLLKITKKPKIGISWKSVVNIYGKLKSLEIKNFKNIFDEKYSIINLQYGNVEKDLKESKIAGYNILTINEVDLFNDLDGSLSLLRNLDVFITVSNSTAHLAGALGIPTALICPKKSSTYFYWNYDKKSPWYNNIRIFKLDHSVNKTMSEVKKYVEKILWK